MAKLQSGRPRPALQPYVRGFAQRDYPTGTSIVEPFVPSVEPVISFLFAGDLRVTFADGIMRTPPTAGVVGAHLKLGSLHLTGPVDMFAVFFRPAGFSDLFRMPVGPLMNAHYDLSSVIPKAERLIEQLAAARSFDDRVVLMETYLVNRLTSITRPSVMHAANTLARNKGMVRIMDLAAAYGLSVRQFERRFSEEVGVNPKSFARAARFQAALDAKVSAPNRTWCEIAHLLGYHDQMHLIHDFRKLTGRAPSHLVDVLGDAQPLASTDQDRSSTDTWRSPFP